MQTKQHHSENQLYHGFLKLQEHLRLCLCQHKAGQGAEPSEKVLCGDSHQLFAVKQIHPSPEVSAQNNEMGNLETHNPKKCQTSEEKKLHFPSVLICFKVGNRISKHPSSLFSTCSDSKGHKTACELPSHFSQHPLCSLLNCQQSPRLISQTIFCTYLAFLSN